MAETIDLGAILPAIKDAVKSEQLDIAEALKKELITFLPQMLNISP